MENLLRALAERGSSSDTRTPGTAVGIALKLPRMSDTASGLGSNVSSWLAPPAWNRTMHDRSLLSLAASNFVKLMPENASDPTLRKSRRLVPNSALGGRMIGIVKPSQWLSWNSSELRTAQSTFSNARRRLRPAAFSAATNRAMRSCSVWLGRRA